MDDALVAYNAGRVDGAAGYRDPQIAGDPEIGADYRPGSWTAGSPRST